MCLYIFTLILYNDIVFPFGIDSSGNYGYYKAGADTVTPFKSGDGVVASISYGLRINVWALSYCNSDLFDVNRRSSTNLLIYGNAIFTAKEDMNCNIWFTAYPVGSSSSAKLTVTANGNTYTATANPIPVEYKVNSDVIHLTTASTITLKGSGSGTLDWYGVSIEQV